MKQTPNYRSREDLGLLFAVQLLNTDESIAKFMEILGFDAPDRSLMIGIEFKGEDYPLGSWVTVCHCGLCEEEGAGNVEMWTNEEFHETFEPIDVPDKNDVKITPQSMKDVLDAMSKAMGEARRDRIEKEMASALAKASSPDFSGPRANQDPVFASGCTDCGEPSEPETESEKVESLTTALLDVIENHRMGITVAATLGCLEFVKLDLFKRECAD